MMERKQLSLIEIIMEITEFQKCRDFLTEVLTNDPSIPICSDHNNQSVDWYLEKRIKQSGNEKEWLVCDVTEGYQINKWAVADHVLYTLVGSQTVFENKEIGKFVIEERYGPMSVRSYYAVLVEKKGYERNERQK